MSKKIVRLTESDIKNIIMETVQRIVSEDINDEMDANNDVIEGLFENGATYSVVYNVGKDDCATLEIVGISGEVYEVKVYLDCDYQEIEGDYLTPNSEEHSEEVSDVEILFYDEDGNENHVNYIKNEDFENELLNYIQVEYSDYDPMDDYDTDYDFEQMRQL